MKKNILFFGLVMVIVASCSKISDVQKLQNIEELTSCEYKLLLNPEKFDDYGKGFADYWKIILKVANEENISIVADENPLEIKKYRKVGVFDTKNLDLRKKGYMIRRRAKLSDGIAKPGVEFSLKFRSANSEIAKMIDVNIADGYIPKDESIELESDVVYNSASNGGEEITFSVQNSIKLPNDPNFTIGEFSKIYPVLATFDLPMDEELILVANTEPIEFVVSPGILDFGDDLICEMDITVRVTELDGKKMTTPEFSFDHPFNNDKIFSDEALNMCTSFMNKLESKYPDWVVPGKLKSTYLFEYEKGKNKEEK